MHAEEREDIKREIAETSRDRGQQGAKPESLQIEANYQQLVESLLIERDQLRDAAKSSQSQFEQLVNSVEGLKRDLESDYDNGGYSSSVDAIPGKDSNAALRSELHSMRHFIEEHIQAASSGAVDSDHSSYISRARGPKDPRDASRVEHTPDDKSTLTRSHVPFMQSSASSTTGSYFMVPDSVSVVGQSPVLPAQSMQARPEVVWPADWTPLAGKLNHRPTTLLRVDA